MAYEMNNQVKPRQSVSTLLASNSVKSLAQNLHLTNDQLMKANSTALTLSTNPALRRCEPISIIKYVYEVARMNFSRDDCVYPVPYGNSIQAQVGYKGFKELAMRSGEYLDVNCKIVYDCDRIERDEDTGIVKVKFEKDYDKVINAKVKGYYAYAISKETKEICNTVYWSKEKCEKHGREYSKTFDSLWGKNEQSFNKMALKTVLKQLCNELSTTPQLEYARKQDGYVYGEGYADNPQNNKKVLNEIDSTFEEEVEEIIDNPAEEVEIEE